MSTRLEHAMRMVTQYPYSCTKFSGADLAVIRNFITVYDHLNIGEFELKVNRMFLDNPSKPKNYVAIMELLTVCNTACYNSTPVKEVPMSTITKDEPVTVQAAKPSQGHAIPAAPVETAKISQELTEQLQNAVASREVQQAVLNIGKDGSMPPSKTPESVKIGEQIKAKRTELGLKRDALALQLGISVAYLGLIENGGPTWLSPKLEEAFGKIGLVFDRAMLDAKNAAAKAYDRAAAERAKANKAKA